MHFHQIEGVEFTRQTFLSTLYKPCVSLASATSFLLDRANRFELRHRDSRNCASRFSREQVARASLQPRFNVIKTRAGNPSVKATNHELAGSRELPEPDAGNDPAFALCKGDGEAPRHGTSERRQVDEGG